MKIVSESGFSGQIEQVRSTTAFPPPRNERIRKFIGPSRSSTTAFPPLAEAVRRRARTVSLKERRFAEFLALCALEPRLMELYQEARAIKAGRTQFYFLEQWYGYRSGRGRGLRERLEQLVGWDVRRRGGDPRLATSEAFDVAYQTIYNAPSGRG